MEAVGSSLDQTLLEAPMKKTNAVLWTVQVVLALLFLFAGGMKLVMPADQIVQQAQLPVALFRFIGVAEIAGGLGLVLPGLFRIRPALTPLAAAGLVVIMVGAVIITVARGPAATAVVPFVVGVLAAFVAWGRTRVAPLRARLA
jgi:uncharacterized membrane protein YphA (DoxX/SURF4 family)